MKTKFLWMLGIVAMLVSCNQNEDVLQNAADELSTVTIVAGFSDGMQTRASYNEDNAANRCILEVRDADGTLVGEQYTATGAGPYSFTIKLKLGEKYDYLLWADDGSSYVVEDLTNITVAAGEIPGIAYHGKLENQEASDMSITLTHAVAKVTLQTTGNVEADKALSVQMQMWSAFDVSKGAKKEGATQSDVTISHTTQAIDNATTGAPQEVLSFYALVEQELVNATVSYNGNSTTLENVPVQPDYRTVLKGDVGNIGVQTGTITVSLDADWGDKENQQFPQLKIETAGSLTAEMIKTALANGNKTLVLTGEMNADDIQTLSAYAKANPNAISTLDMGHCNNTATDIPDAAFQDVNGLHSVILPEGITTIGQFAFSIFEDGLTNIKLPESLTTIKLEAFIYGKLTTVVIPKNVTKIEDSAFQYQRGLKTITFKGTTPPSVNTAALPTDNAFTLYVPKGCVEAYKAKLSEIYKKYVTEIPE